MKSIIFGFMIILLAAGTVFSQTKNATFKKTKSMTTIAEIKAFIQGGVWTSLSTELRPFGHG